MTREYVPLGITGGGQMGLTYKASRANPDRGSAGVRAVAGCHNSVCVQQNTAAKVRTTARQTNNIGELARTSCCSTNDVNANVGRGRGWGSSCHACQWHQECSLERHLGSHCCFCWIEDSGREELMVGLICSEEVGDEAIIYIRSASSLSISTSYLIMLQMSPIPHRNC